jgi:nitric oxide reductase large subunit
LLIIARKLHKRLFYRHLNDYLFVGMVWTGMFAVATFCNKPNSYTILTYVISVIVLIVIIGLVAYIFFVVLTVVQKKKPNFNEIQGLVEDL